METHSIKGGIIINAPAFKVWDTLTDPAKIIQYLGSQISTDWKVGSPITWTGEMQGVKFVNKGEVLQYQPNEILQFTYWSGMGGDPDEPHNYSTITYHLKELEANKTDFMYTREKIPTELEKSMFENFLDIVLAENKRIAES